MAIPHAGLDHGDMGILHHGADQPCAAARDEHVQVIGQAHHFDGGCARGVLHQLDTVRGQPGFFHRLAHRLSHCRVRMDGLLPAAQNDGVARLQAERRRVRRHVGARLVDDADHAERHAHALDLQAVGTDKPAHHLPDRVLLRRHLAHSLRHPGNAGRGQRQPVQHAFAHPALPRRLQVLFVCGQDLRLVRFNGVRHLQKGRVLFGPGHRQRTRRLLCLLSHLL